jgi:hypothetical protein
MQVTDCLKNSCIGEEKTRCNREISLPPGENRSSENDIISHYTSPRIAYYPAL